MTLQERIKEETKNVARADENIRRRRNIKKNARRRDAAAAILRVLRQVEALPPCTT